MAIPDFNATKPHDQSKPTIKQPESPSLDVSSTYNTVSVNNDVTLRSALQTHISGSSWFTETYFNQILQSTDSPKPFDIKMPAHLQQYLAITRFELKVTQALQSTYDEQTGEYLVTGSANLYTGLIPHVGDCFIAKGADGIRLLFNVTAAKPLTYFGATAYEINYSVVGQVKPETDSVLKAKTQRTQIFVRDLFNAGQNPFLVDSEYDDYLNMNRMLAQLPKEYYREFYNTEYGTLLVPSQDYTTYDPFVVRFFKALVSQDTFFETTDIRVLNTDGDDELFTTVYDAGLEGNPDVIDRCISHITVVDTKAFSRNAFYNGIAYSGVARCLWPREKASRWQPKFRSHTSVSKYKHGKNTPLNRKIPLSELYGSNGSKALTTGQSQYVQWISDYEDDQPYVFGSAFYGNEEGQSLVELMYREACKGTFFNPPMILKACRDRIHWTDTTRFQIVPILMYILRVCIGNMR